MTTIKIQAYNYQVLKKFHVEDPLQYDNVIYQVIAPCHEYVLRNAEVTVLETKDGVVFIEYRGKQLTAVPHHKMQAQTEVVSAKELIVKLAERKERCRYRPSRRHPWKRGPRGFSNKHKLAC